ncbi:MAG: hypothetical protein RBT70_09320 [Alphaproteobacteria bacterium]|nr:hypothetical protein [Alphaproteobacteria bacterium]
MADFPQNEIAKYEHAPPVPEAIAAVAPKFFEGAGGGGVEQQYRIQLAKPIGTQAAATCFDEGLKESLTEDGIRFLSSTIMHSDGQMLYDAEVRATDARKVLRDVIANASLYGPDAHECVVNADHPEAFQAQFGDPAVGSHFTLAMKNVSRGAQPRSRQDHADRLKVSPLTGVIP